jgi:hypothetical protein
MKPVDTPCGPRSLRLGFSGLLIAVLIPALIEAQQSANIAPSTPQMSVSTQSDTTPVPRLSVADDIIARLAANGEDEKVSVLNLDLAIPESPAFAVLGLTPEAVVRPTTLREFVTTLLNGVDRRGNLQSGVAIDVAPWRLGEAQEGEDGLTIREYRRSYIKQVLLRSKVSIGSAVGTSSEDRSARVALGFTTTPFDAGDPVLDRQLTRDLRNAWQTLQREMGDELTPTPPARPRPVVYDSVSAYQRAMQDYSERLGKDAQPLPDLVPAKQLTNLTPEQRKSYLESYVEQLQIYGMAVFQSLTTAATRARQARYVELIDAAFEEAKDRNWNASSWTLGIVPSFISTNGNLGDLHENALGFWTSYAQRLGNSAQVLLHARYLDNEMVPDPEQVSSFLEQDSRVLGLRFRLGSPSLGFSLEGVHVRDSQESGSDDTYHRLSVGSEFKVAQNYWLAFSVGGEGGHTTENESFVLGALKWGFNTNPTVR